MAPTPGRVGHPLDHLAAEFYAKKYADAVAENERLRELLRRAHIAALQGGWHTSDPDDQADIGAVRAALSGPGTTSEADRIEADLDAIFRSGHREHVRRAQAPESAPQEEGQ